MKKFTFLMLTLGVFYFSNAQSHYSPRAFLGVESNHLSKDKANTLDFKNTYGAYVTEVIENTTAERAGVRPFDYLVGFDEKYFSENQSFSHAIRTYKAGDQAILKLVRNGQEMSIPVTFGKQSEAIYRKIPKEEQALLGVEQQHYNWQENVPGVKVNIVNNSAAEAMGMQDDDIITMINNQQIIDWHDLGNAIDNMKPGEPISLEFMRDGQKMSGTSNIKSYGETHSRDHQKENKNNAGTTVNEEKEEETAELPTSAFSEVDMEELTQEEADDMKEKVGVDMPVINNLEIEKLNIFPNPNDGVFNLTFDLPDTGQTTIRIFNGTGRQVYQNDMQEFSGFFKDRIDISNNAKGIYFLEVNQSGKSITRKVIFQ